MALKNFQLSFIFLVCCPLAAAWSQSPAMPEGKVAYAFLPEYSGKFVAETGIRGGLFTDGPIADAPLNPKLEEYVAWTLRRDPKARYLMIDCERRGPGQPDAIEIAKRAAQATDKPIGWYESVGLGAARASKWHKRAKRRLEQIAELPIDAVFVEAYVRWPQDTPESFLDRCRAKVALARQASGKEVVLLLSPGYHATHPRGNQLVESDFAESLRKLAEESDAWATWRHPETNKLWPDASVDQKQQLHWMFE